MTMEQWNVEQLDAFERDGFVVIDEGFLDDDTVAELRERFEPLFDGRYESGIRPDEVNWVPGRDPDDRTRQICNGWKADPRLAAQTEIARKQLAGLSVKEMRLERRVHLIYRRGANLSHAAKAFLTVARGANHQVERAID